MKKMMSVLALMLAVMMLAAGCGSTSGETAAETNSGMNESESTEETEAPVRGDFVTEDYVTVKDYKGMEIKKSDITPSDDDLQEKIDELVSNATELKEVDRAAKEGDTVNIDYVGTKDGEEFDGGSATSYDLELGSDTFIDGFEDGLIGKKAGDKVDLDLTFPDDYSNSDLAGQAVTFAVTVNAVKESVTPEYNDELVKDQTDYDTVKEYEKATKEEMQEDNLDNAIYSALMEDATFEEELPETLVTYYQETYANYYNSMFSSYYGTTLDEYLESQDMTRDDFYTQVGVENYVKIELIWRYIFNKEGYEIGSKDYKSWLKDQVEEYEADSEEALIEQYGEDNVEYEYIYETAYNFVKDNVVYK